MNEIKSNLIIKKTNRGYRVLVDGTLWQSQLSPDEALGVVAKYLFSDEHHLFLKTTQQHRLLSNHLRTIRRSKK